MKSKITNLKCIIIFIMITTCSMLVHAQTWNLTGNAATDTLINFMGTTDAKGVKFKTSNLTRMYIDKGGKIGIGTVNPQSNLDIYVANGGAQMGVRSDSGNAVLFFDKKHSSDYNTVSYRTAGAVQWQTGSIGNDNYVIKNMILGAPAITFLNANNNVGIGTNTPAYKLDVNGTGRYVGALKIGAYTLPATDGTIGQVLTTNGAGGVSWATGSGSGANTSLSNLAPTSINQSLIPDNTLTQSLGSYAKLWNGIYASHLFLNNKRFEIPGGSLYFDVGTFENNLSIGNVNPYLMTGSGNVLYGLSAGLNITTGEYNSMLGTDVGSTTTGSSNCFMGHLAGWASLTGSYNTLIGDSSGYINATGNKNTCIGHNTNTGIGISHSTAIGSDALVTQNNSVVLGTSADNIGIGTSAPTAKLDIIPSTANAINIQPYGSAAGNTGELRLDELASQGNNYTGFKPPDSLSIDLILTLPNTQGSLNQVLSTDGSGKLKWKADNIGTSVTEMVYNVGTQNTFTTNSHYTGNTGADNTYIGFSTGKTGSTGSFNTFIGDDAGSTIASGMSNTFVGHRAGIGTISGHKNTMIGDSTGILNSSGNNNSYLGYHAGGYGNGSNNTFVGGESGNGNTGSNNTFVGYNATATSGAVNATAIGYNAVVAASNSLVLGDNVNVGIGTSTPAYKLDVTGTGHFTGTLKIGNYTLPATDGTASQVLLTNGAGILSWGIDSSASYNAGPGISIVSKTISNTGDLNASDDITISTSAGGDLSGTYPNPSVNKIKGISVSSTTPTNGQVLKYNNSTTQWEPNTDNNSGGTMTSITTGVGLTGGYISTSGTISAQNTAPLWNANQIQGKDVTTTLPTINQVLKFDGTNWKPDADNNTIYLQGGGISIIGNTISTSPMLGDVTGNTSANTVTKIQGRGVSNVAPTVNQILKFDGINWVPNSDNNSGGTVFSITTGTGLTPGTITSFGTINAETTLPLWNANQIQGKAVTNTVPTTGQVLKFDGTNWKPDVDNVTVYTAGTGISIAGSTLNSVWTASGNNIYNNNSSNVGVGTNVPNAKLDILPSTANAINVQPFGVAAGNTGELRLDELAANGTNYVGFKSPDNLSANKIYTLPSIDGTTGQVLSTNGSGVLSWAAQTGANALTGNGTATQVAFYNTSNTLTSNSNFQWDNANNRLGIGTSSPLVALDVNGDLALNDHPIHLRNGGNNDHTIGYAANVDGPAIVGYAGGGLGTVGNPYSLKWSFTGDVSVRNSLIVDETGTGNGSFNTGLHFGSSSGEGITSDRNNVSNNPYGLDFYAGNSKRFSLTNGGNLIPSNDSAYDLGSSTNGWKNIYMDGALFTRQNGYVTRMLWTDAFVLSENTFVGPGAGKVNSGAGLNTFVGFAVGQNCTGARNSFLGGEAGSTNTTGTDNVFIGTMSGKNNLSANNNTFLGAYSGFANSTGAGNTYLGHASGKSNTIGNDNVLIGDSSGYGDTKGSLNVFIGKAAGRYNNDANGNVFIGWKAGYLNTSGAANTYVGNEAKGSTNYTNSGSFGNNAVAPGSNSYRIGDSAVTYIGGQVSWSTGSDSRLKKNIKSYDLGLDFILKLRPVSYNYIAKGQEGINYNGFIAQEVESTLNELHTEFSGLCKPQNEKDFYSLRYAEFVVPIVNAIKEQQVEIQSKDSLISMQQQQLNNQQQQIDELKNNMTKFEIALSQCCTNFNSENNNPKPTELKDAAHLEQNMPNPFSVQSKIRFYIPSSFHSAIISVSDLSGKSLKTFQIKNSGFGEVIINADELASGNYLYSLIVDDTKIDTKMMELTK